MDLLYILIVFLHIGRLLSPPVGMRAANFLGIIPVTITACLNRKYSGKKLQFTKKLQNLNFYKLPRVPWVVVWVCFINADPRSIADEDVSNSLQDMTLDAGRFNSTTFILRDVLSNHEKHVLFKTLLKCLRLLYIFDTFLIESYGLPSPGVEH